MITGKDLLKYPGLLAYTSLVKNDHARFMTRALKFLCLLGVRFWGVVIETSPGKKNVYLLIGR